MRAIWIAYVNKMNIRHRATDSEELAKEHSAELRDKLQQEIIHEIKQLPHHNHTLTIRARYPQNKPTVHDERERILRHHFSYEQGSIAPDIRQLYRDTWELTDLVSFEATTQNVGTPRLALKCKPLRIDPP